MLTVLIFSVTLMLAVLISDLARRSVLSTAVLFLVVGFATGFMGGVRLEASDPVVARLAELALISTLFTDGMRIGFMELRSAWHLPGRALLLGLPLTLLGTAVLAHYMTGISWGAALLVGAALSPTDPVFAAALVGSEKVPHRLRRLLNVESGLNDGLALPIVMILLTQLGSGHTAPWMLAGELLGGVAIGILVPVLCVWLYRTRFFAAAPVYRPLFGFAVLMLVWSGASIVHANTFLAAFAAGITLASISEKARAHFAPMGERLAELLKLAALLIFGALISWDFLRDVHVRGYLFAIAAIVLARPAALLLALAGSNLSWPEKLASAWFGPKGFASVVFGLLIMGSTLPDHVHLFHLIGITVAGSVLAHSSTDVWVSRWFEHIQPEQPSRQSRDQRQ